MEPDDTVIERDLIEAHVLIERKEYAQARELLNRLLSTGTPSSEVAPLLAQIEAERSTAKPPADDRRQAWRYYLGLRSSGGRAGRLLVAAGMAVYGLWNGLDMVEQGLAQGFYSEITTHVQTGRYSTTEWTHPIYQDVLLNAAIVMLGLAAVVVIVWASRGAADWEGLDEPDATPSPWTWRFWW